MKKYVMFSLVLVVLSTAFTSCHKTDAYDPDRPEEDARQLYDRNFLAYVGGTINAKVDWGFGQTARTRSFTREDYTPTVTLDPKGYSDEFNYKAFQTIQEYFPEGGVCKSDKWTNFEFQENCSFFDVHIIYSHTTKNDEIGFYYYDPANQTFEDHVKVPLYNIVQDGQSDLGEYLQFNRDETGGNWFSVYYNDGYSIWNDDTPAQRIRTRVYVVDLKANYHFGFYVTNIGPNGEKGKTYYTNQYLNENETQYSGAAIGDVPVENLGMSYIFGLTDDDVADCNFLFEIPQIGIDGKYPTLIRPEKITPPDPPAPEPEWHRIIAEDLNAHDVDHDGDQDDTDFDFNDVVLDVALTETGAKCILQAAGATLKIRINGDDRLEVHDMFGVDQGVMVNTHAEKKGLAHADKDPVEFDLTGSFSSISDIKLEVYKKVDNKWKWLELTAPVGRPSCKIAVKIDFEWPDERESLKVKYPDFLNYVQNNQDVEDWWRQMNNP